METRNKQNGDSIDLYSITRDILSHWLIILMFSLSAALLAYMFQYYTYTPKYTIDATYAISSNGTNNFVFENLTTAESIASRFSEVINSSTLQNLVEKDLGMPMEDTHGSIESTIVEETNLLVLSVTSSTPKEAFLLMNSVMKNFPAIAEHLVGDAVMKVMKAPSIPEEPDRALSLKLPMAIAFVFAAMLLAAFFGLLSYLKDTLRKPDDVEKKLDTKLLGTINHETKYKTMMAKMKRNQFSMLISSRSVSFHYVEVFQKIVWKLSHKMEEKDAKVLIVTSCLENEGKSTVAANIALGLAQNGKKTILVDLDLRKPALYKVFETKKSKGNDFAKILDGSATGGNFITKSNKADCLYTMFNTREYNNSTEMLMNGQMEKILLFLREKFDYIILDTPPMAHVADTEEIANMADASILVVREHKATAKGINDAIDALNSTKAACLGCVFNDAHDKLSKNIFRNGASGDGGKYGRYGNYYGHYGRR